MCCSIRIMIKVAGVKFIVLCPGLYPNGTDTHCVCSKKFDLRFHWIDHDLGNNYVFVLDTHLPVATESQRCSCKLKINNSAALKRAMTNNAKH